MLVRFVLFCGNNYANNANSHWTLTEEINSDVGKMPREQMRKNRNEAIHKKSETPRLFCVCEVTSFIIF